MSGAFPEGSISTAGDAAVDEASPVDDVIVRRLGLLFWLSIGWVVAIILAATFAPWLPIPGPEERQTLPGVRPPYPPSGDFLFGSDTLTRDILSRTIYGARVSLVVGFVAIAFGMLVGGSLGIIGGYFRGWIDKIVSFVFLVLLSFPALVLAILITALLNRSLFTISMTLGFLAIAPVGRLARATTIQYAEREFVVAARTLGAKHPRIIIRELLPNVVIPMGALALLGMAVAIVAEGSLAFLGLSVEEGPTWGKVIVDGSGSRALKDSWWMAMTPILFLFLTVVSLNFAGDRLRAYFDVKETAL